jgi:hypothetical protein
MIMIHSPDQLSIFLSLAEDVNDRVTVSMTATPIVSDAF